jgi:hypothetical protein
VRPRRKHSSGLSLGRPNVGMRSPAVARAIRVNQHAGVGAGVQVGAARGRWRPLITRRYAWSLPVSYSISFRVVSTVLKGRTTVDRVNNVVKDTHKTKTLALVGDRYMDVPWASLLGNKGSHLL